MRSRLASLIVITVLLGSRAFAQDTSIPEGKTITETYVSNLRTQIGSDVIIKGIAGSVKADPSNTRVYSLTDKFGKTVRVRAAQGNPPLAQTYLVHGYVTASPGGELELNEIERREPSTQLGVGTPEVWVVVDGRLTEPKTTESKSSEPGAKGEVGAKEDGKSGETEGGEKKNNLPYLLLGGGAILVIAAVVIGLSMKSASDRRLREQQMQAEQQRMAEMQRQMEMQQRQAVQPGSTLVNAPSPASPPPPPPGTMVSWGSLNAVAGPLKDRVFPLPHGAINIGRTEGDIKLETDQSVSSRHATISQTGDGTVYFEDHSTNGSFVNERRLNNEKVPLQSGDKIVIGPHTFEIKYSRAAVGAASAAASAGAGAGATVVVPVPQAATVAFTGLQLVVEEGPDQGKAFPVNMPQTTIGRDDSRDVILSDEHVSRKHATIANEDGKWILQNESNQGTSVNGAKVESRELQDGDSIRLGTTVLRFKRLA